MASKRLRGSRIAGFALTLLAGVMVAPLHAQETTYAGPILDRSTLTGDWGGARDWLASNGLVIRSDLTQFYEGSLSGNTDEEVAGATDETFDYGAKLDIFADVDASNWLWNGFGIHAKGEFNFGNTPGNVGGLSLPNSPALAFPCENEDCANLTSFYFSQRFGDDVSFSAGKINIVDLYSAGQLYNGGRGIERFMNIALTAPPSGTIPVALFGAIGSVKVDPFKFGIWVYDPRETVDIIGLEDPFGEGVSVRGSVDYASNPFGLNRTDSFAAFTSNYLGTDFTTLPELGRFRNSPEFRASLIRALVERGDDGQDGQGDLPPQILQRSPPEEKDGRYYFSYAFQQELWQDATNPTRNVGLFGQIAFSDGNPNPTKWSMLGGIGGTGIVPGRPIDRFGVGAFYYSYSQELKDALDPLIELGDEYGAEVFYNFAVTKWFWVTADLQVIDPAVKSQVVLGKRTREDNTPVTLATLRAQLKF